MAGPRSDGDDAVVRLATLVLLTNSTALTFTIPMALVFLTSTSSH